MAIYDITTQQIDPSSLQPGDIINCPYSGQVQSINLPSGTFKFECWGAQGGTASYYDGSTKPAKPGGKGGYSVGTILLNYTRQLFLYSGGRGTDSPDDAGVISGGFNGGGDAYVRSRGGYTSSTGGGASDIRLGQDSLYARVIVAGGGGGVNYNTVTGGLNGGGLTGDSTLYAEGGTQTEGGHGVGDYAVNGSFGQGASHLETAGQWSGGASGAGGWYGGGNAWYRWGHGGGGSGYVYTNITYVNYPSGCLLSSTDYLISAETIGGSQTFTAPDGTTEIGHSDNGYVRITVLSLGTNQFEVVPTVTNGTYSGDYGGFFGDAINGQLIPNTNYTFNTNYGASVSITDGSGDITSSAYNPNDGTISLLLTSNVSIQATAFTNTISYNLTKCTSSNNNIIITPRTSYSTTITPVGNAELSSVTVTMGGVDVTSSVYNATNHTITITSVTGNIIIIAVAISATVTFNLTNCASSQASGEYKLNSSFTATLTPTSGYSILSDINPITVVMGGVDITSTAYNYSTGVITINSLTGNLTVTAAAQITSITYRTGAGAPEWPGWPVYFKPLNFTYTLGSSISIKLETFHGYKIDYTTVSVIMDNVDITNNVVDTTNDKIIIPRSGVTITITAKATAINTTTGTLNIASVSDYHFSDENTYTIRAVKNGEYSPYVTKFELYGTPMPQLEGTTSFNYDGAEHGPLITNYDSSVCTVTGTPTATQPGNYSVTITRPSSYFWKSDTPSERIQSSYSFNWSIAKNNRTISSNLTNGLVFNDDNPTIIGELTAPLKGTETLRVYSSDTGAICGYLSGRRIIIQSERPSTGTISIQLLGNDYFNDSNILTYTYTSTITDYYNYGDGSLNTVQGGYEGRLLVNGRQQWYNSWRPLNYDTSNFRSSMFYMSSQSFPSRTGYENTALIDSIFSCSSAERITRNYWTPNGSGLTVYPFTSSMSSSLQPLFDMTGWNYADGNANFNLSFTSPAPENTTVVIASSWPGETKTVSNFKVMINNKYYTLKEAVDYAMIKPLVIIDAARPSSTDDSYIRRGMLNLYENISPYAYVNTSSAQGETYLVFLFMLNKGYSCSGFTFHREGGQYDLHTEWSASYTPIENARMTITEV